MRSFSFRLAKLYVLRWISVPIKTFLHPSNESICLQKFPQTRKLGHQQLPFEVPFFLLTLPAAYWSTPIPYSLNIIPGDELLVSATVFETSERQWIR